MSSQSIFFLTTLQTNRDNKGYAMDVRDEFPEYGIFTDKRAAEKAFEDWLGIVSNPANYLDYEDVKEVQVSVILFRVAPNGTFNIEEPDVVRWVDVTINILPSVVVNDRTEERAGYNVDED